MARLFVCRSRWRRASLLSHHSAASQSENVRFGSAFRGLLFLLTVGLALLVPSVDPTCSVFAQETESEPEEKPAPQRPLAVINVAGIERLLSDADYLFETAGRPEMSDFLGGLLANVNDFDGVDRNKPLGVMVFFTLELGLQPVPVAYVPVNDIDKFADTLAVARVTLKESSDAENRYELIGRRVTMHLKLENGYAFITRKPDAFDRPFIDPVALTKILSDRYDVGLLVDLDTIGDGVKTVFLEFLRASAQAELQQRAEESDERYRLRRANGESLLYFIEQTLTHGERLLAGLNVSNRSRDAIFEIALETREDSSFAKALADIGGKTSHFAQQLDKPAPLTLSFSWGLGAHGRDVLLDALQDDRPANPAAVPETAPIPAVANPLQEFLETLRPTIQAGRIDAFLQFLGNPEEKFVLIGGAQVVDGARVGAALRKILEEAGRESSETTITLDAHSYQGVVFHQIARETAPPQEVRLYGEPPVSYVGAGPTALWFAVGPPAAKTAIQEAIDTVAAPEEKRRLVRDPDAPFRLTVDVATWIGLFNPPEPLAQRLKDAFAPGDSTMHVDIRPTESGLRFRIRWKEGFLRFVGLSIAHRIDESLSL